MSAKLPIYVLLKKKKNFNTTKCPKIEKKYIIENILKSSVIISAKKRVRIIGTSTEI